MPKGGPVHKTWIRMEKVARLETMGLSDAEIAAHVGLTPAGLAGLKNKATYKALKVRISSGVLSDFDKGLAEDNKYLRERVREMVPAALESLFKAATQNADMKLAVNASTEILDRDGRFGKVSRIGLPTEEQGGFAASQSDLDMATQLAQIVRNTASDTDAKVVSITDLVQ